MNKTFITCAGVLALAIGGVAQSAQAITTTYNTKTSGDWSNPANWSAGVPHAGDTANNTQEQVMTDFDGQSVGVINASGKKFYLIDNGTLTMNNLGSLATITAATSQLGSTTVATVIKFTDNLTVNVTNSNAFSVYNEFQGAGTLALTGGGVNSYASGSFNVGRLDVSGESYVRFQGNGASMAGATVFTGSTTTFVLGTSSHFAGLDGSNLEMTDAYALFQGNTGETLNVGTFEVGSTYLPIGIYNSGSGMVDAVDVGAIFADSNVKVSVTEAAPVPEPASLALLGLGAMGLLVRQRKGGAA